MALCRSLWLRLDPSRRCAWQTLSSKGSCLRHLTCSASLNDAPAVAEQVVLPKSPLDVRHKSRMRQLIAHMVDMRPDQARERFLMLVKEAATTFTPATALAFVSAAGQAINDQSPALLDKNTTALAHQLLAGELAVSATTAHDIAPVLNLLVDRIGSSNIATFRQAGSILRQSADNKSHDIVKRALTIVNDGGEPSKQVLIDLLRFATALHFPLIFERKPGASGSRFDYNFFLDIATFLQECKSVANLKTSHPDLDIYYKYIQMSAQRIIGGMKNEKGYVFMTLDDILAIPDFLLQHHIATQTTSLEYSDIFKLEIVRRLFLEWVASITSLPSSTDSFEAVENFGRLIVSYWNSAKKGDISNTKAQESQFDTILALTYMTACKILLEGPLCDFKSSKLSYDQSSILAASLKSMLPEAASRWNCPTDILTDFVITFTNCSIHHGFAYVPEIWYYFSGKGCSNILLTAPVFVALIRGMQETENSTELISALMGLYGEMCDREVPISREVYAELFLAASRIPVTRQDRRIYDTLTNWEQDMDQAKILHDEKTIKALIVALFSCSYIPSAAMRLEDMRAQGIPRGSQFYSDIFFVCTRTEYSAAWAAGEFDFLCNVLYEVDPSVDDLVNIVKCCAKIKDPARALNYVDFAERLFGDKEVEIGSTGAKSKIVPSKELYLALSSALKSRDTLTMLEMEKLELKLKHFPET